MATTDRASALFDFAVDNPDGFTRDEACEELDLTKDEFFKAARDVRRAFAEDTITLSCDPQGSGEQWLYRLVGTVDDSSPWVSNRLGDAESRFVTIAAVIGAIKNSTDGRTVNGRKAREIHLSVTQLLERLKLIGELYS